MLCRKFELIPIKNWIFYNFFKVAQKSGQSPCTIVHCLWPKMNRREFFIFIIPIKIRILKLLKNRAFGQISTKMARKEFSTF